MRHSLINPYDVRRYLNLWTVAVFDDDGDSGGGGGDSGGGGGSDDKPKPNTIGQVSATGQYAGDGFEWVDNGSGGLSRTYTGAGKDNNLGQDVIAGGTADKNVKAAIATVSLNEGSQFAGSQASVTDYDALDIVRSPENQTASSSFAEQAGVSNYEPSIVYGDDDDTPVAQAMEEEESFGDAFARNRAAGADTFTYNGNLYTTDLAPEPAAPAPAPTPGYATMGVGEAGRGGEAEMRVVDQVDTSQPLPDEEDLFEQPVVSESAQDYLDTLGTDFDFGQFDDDTPGIDYTVSQGEAGRGGPDSAAPVFTYVPSETPGVSTPAAGRDLDADLGIGMSDSTITADQYESGEGYGTYPTTLDGGSVSVADDSGYVDTLMETGDALSIVNAGGVDTSPPEKEETLGETILNTLAGRSSIDRALGIDRFSPYIANVPVGVTQGIGALTSGLGQTIDQLAGTSQTNLALERMRDMGPMSNAQEEFMIRQAAEEGLRMRDTALKPRDETFYQAGSIPFDFAQEMKEYYEDTIPGYEGRENIYKNLETYEDVVGFGPGQIDRQLLDAAQAKQSPLETAIFGQGPGSAVRMDGSGFDPSTAAQKSIEGAGSTAPLLGLSLLGPAGTAAAIAGGQQSVTGELSQETDAALQGLYETGRLQQSDRFKQLVAANQGDESKALQRMQQDARDLSQLPSAALGGGATAVEAALLRMGLPGAAAIPIVEGLQEGPGESIAANQILQTVTGFGLPVNRQEMLESGTAGIGGGATVAVPVSGAQAFVPSGPRAGQPAASTVPTEYQEAGVRGVGDSLVDTGMSGVGDVVADAEAMASEMLMEGTITFDGSNNILTNEETGLSYEIDPKVTSLQEASTDIVLGNTPEGARVVTPPATATADIEAATPAGQEGMSFEAKQRLNKAVAEKKAEGILPVKGGVSLEQAGQESVTAKPAAGIETALPKAAEEAVTSKMDADAAAPLQTAAADAAKTIDAAYKTATKTPGTLGKLKDAFTGLTESQQKAGAEAFNKGVEEAIADLQNTYNLTEDQARDAVMTAVEENTQTQMDELDSKTFLDILTGNFEGSLVNLSKDSDVAAVIDIPEEFQEQMELPLEGDQTKTLEDDQTKTLAEDQTKTLEDDQTKTLEDDQTKTLEDDQTKTLEEDQTSTTVSVPVITQTTSTGEDDEVEVDVDDTTTTDTGDDVTVDVDVDDIFVPVVTTTDDDGNTITECPEGYVMVETPDGPMCQKSVEQVRQRAGRGVQAYTGIVTRPGERGPGQRRITTTRTERVRPTTRSA